MKIHSFSPVDHSVNVTIDSYVPVSIQTYDVSPGLVYYRVGNLKTSLVEIPIDAAGIVRGITVVIFDKVGAFSQSDKNLSSSHGLPVVSASSMPTEYTLDDPCEVEVSLTEKQFFIDWSNGRVIDSKSSFGRLTFYRGSGILLGAALEDVTEVESHELQYHINVVLPKRLAASK